MVYPAVWVMPPDFLLNQKQKNYGYPHFVNHLHHRFCVGVLPDNWNSKVFGYGAKVDPVNIGGDVWDFFNSHPHHGIRR